MGCPQCKARVPWSWRLFGSYIAPERECAICGALLRITFPWAIPFIGAIVIVMLCLPVPGLLRWMGGLAEVLLGLLFFFGAQSVEVVRPGRGHCPKCGYDLTGTAGPVCPECGASRDGGDRAPGAR